MPKITVSTRPPCERRFRAGQGFTAEPREVEVDEAQLATIKTDPLLMLHKPAKAEKIEKTTTPDKGEGK